MKVFPSKRTYRKYNQNQRLNRTIIASGIVSLVAYISLQIFSSERGSPYSGKMIEAARIMEKAVSIIGDYCVRSGISIDKTLDPNQTGLIGPEQSEIVTTLGHLEAKRSTTNPDFAGLIVHLLVQAGVREGDSVAVGCSASFPGLMVASLAAARAMDLQPILIISLGASSYGATNVDFHLLDITQLLIEKGVFTVPPAAITLGGERDIGKDYTPEMRDRLIRQIKSSRIPFIYEPDLRKNVMERLKIYKMDSSDRKVSAFINTGGSYANMGTSSLVLKVRSGLNRSIALPSKSERGVLFEMIARKIPCIHLLYIKGMTMKYGLPWDPVPLPGPRDSNFTNPQMNNHYPFIVIFVFYFVVLISVILFYMKKTCKMK